MTDFDKYQRNGAYHWRQSNPRWGNAEFNPALRSRYQAVAKMLPPHAQSVLDVGCGDAYLLYLISQKSSSIQLYGVDAEPLGVALASQQLAQHERSASIVAGSAYSLPFPSCSFDVVTSADVIEHLENPEQSLQEIHRVLRDRGLLLLSTPNRQPAMKWDNRHVHEFDAEELRSMLCQYFVTVEIFACWPMWWIRQWKHGGRRMKFINNLCRLGFNPFLKTVSTPSVNYGQLIARCIK